MLDHAGSFFPCHYETVPSDARHSCWRLILTAHKWDLGSIGKCTWDKGGYVHERGLSTCMNNSFYRTVFFVVTALITNPCAARRFRRRARAHPPFFPLWIGMAGCVGVHQLCHPPGRFAPVSTIPPGRQEKRPMKAVASRPFLPASGQAAEKLRRKEQERPLN